MFTSPILISVPTKDLKRAYSFYKDGLGLSLSFPKSDGSMPEPVQFDLTTGARLMVVPTGGFSWVLSGNAVAAENVSECVIGVTASSNGEVDALIAKAKAAGGRIASAPEQKPWGYSASFADLDGHLWLVVKPHTPS